MYNKDEGLNINTSEDINVVAAIGGVHIVFLNLYVTTMTVSYDL